MTACKTPPAGWTCSRGAGHEGPCAASPLPLTVEDLVSIANLPGGANEQLRAARDHLRGRWSNGDPVHIITDGVDRWVAPNHNGATWIPETKIAMPYDPMARYFEHERVEREGGTCSCGDTFPAPEEAS